MSPKQRFGLRLVTGVAVLALVIARVRQSPLTLPWGTRLAAGVAAAVVLLLVAQVLSALRWRVILGADAPSLWYLWRLYLVGAFFSLFLPTLVGGDAVRAAAASRAVPKSGSALASVIADRVLGVLALVTYLALGLLFAPDVMTRSGARVDWGLPPWALGAAVLAAAAGAGAVAVLSRRSDRVRRFVVEAGEVAARLRSSPAVFARAFGLALVVQAVHISVWVVLAAGLHFGLPFRAFLVLVPLVTLAAMLPVTISGLGVREGAWLVLLAPFDLPPANIVAYSLLYFGCLMSVGLLGGLAFVTRGTGWTAAAPAGGTPL